MSTRYERNRGRREADRQRNLMGETIAQFHERERATAAIGDHLPRRRCRETDDLFSQRRQLFDKLPPRER